MKNEKTFTLLEVEQLTKNAYNVGFYDGLEGGNNLQFREYNDEDDFWNKNKEIWINKEINLS